MREIICILARTSSELEVIITLLTIYYLGPSRRDDLISVLYMMIHLANGSLPWIQSLKIKDEDERFMALSNMKVSLTST